MAAKNRRKKRECQKKIRYTESEALLAAKRLGRQTRKWVSPYSCTYCKGWHVGRKPTKRGNVGKVWQRV